MKTPDMNAENAFVLLEAAKAADAGYYDHLAHGGKGDPAEERWIEALNAGANALTYIQQLEADNAQQARCIENLTDKLNATNDALPRWISVEERLPKKPCAVLVVMFGNSVCVAWYSIGWFETGSGLHFSAGNGVTHWMPLPEPPEEE